MPGDLVTGQIMLTTVWLFGVSTGLTACTVTCLPFMGTWALGRASGRVEAFLHTGVFLAGRMGRELKSGRAWLGRWLTWAAAVVLILLGLRRLFLVFT